MDGRLRAHLGGRRRSSLKALKARPREAGEAVVSGGGPGARAVGDGCDVGFLRGNVDVRVWLPRFLFARSCAWVGEQREGKLYTFFFFLGGVRLLWEKTGMCNWVLVRVFLDWYPFEVGLKGNETVGCPLF